jgi:hypothetical protein
MPAVSLRFRTIGGISVRRSEASRFSSSRSRPGFRPRSPREREPRRRSRRRSAWTRRACGAVDTDDDSGYRLTAAGACLLDDDPLSFAASLRFDGEFFFGAYGRLWDYQETGAVPFLRASGGVPLFDVLATRPDLAALFAAPMSRRSEQYSAQIAALPALAVLADAAEPGRPVTIVDVGGGEGRLLADILQTYPAANGILLEMAVLEEQATRLFANAGLAARCRFVSGDMLMAVPEGGDAYVLKWVLHDWNDADAETILRRCRAAMQRSRSEGREPRLLIIERLMPERVQAGNALLAASDLNMLCLFGGAERTRAEFAALITRAGLRLESVTPVEDAYGFFALECADADAPD